MVAEAGRQRASCGHSAGAVRRLADDLEPFAFQQDARYRTETVVIIDEQDTRAHACSVTRCAGPVIRDGPEVREMIRTCPAGC
jgi:hypothetical protein